MRRQTQQTPVLESHHTLEGQGLGHLHLTPSPYGPRGPHSLPRPVFLRVREDVAVAEDVNVEHVTEEDVPGTPLCLRVDVEVGGKSGDTDREEGVE